jgi:hypothetical protein
MGAQQFEPRDKAVVFQVAECQHDADEQLLGVAARS